MKRPSERPGPPGGKRDVNRQKRVDDLVEAGLALFLERGIDNVTIDDIAKQAGTAKGNFYRYFTDKTALVSAIIRPVQAELRSGMEQCEQALTNATNRETVSSAYQQLGLTLALIFLRDPRIARMFLQESRGPAIGARAPVRDLADEVADGAVRLTRVACDHGLLRVDDPRVSALAVVGAVERLALAFLAGKLDGDPLQISQMLIGLVLDGIRAPSAE